MTTPRRFSVFIQEQRHYLQRYDTVGDWYVGPVDQGEDLWIKVSSLPDRREIWLVAIHELIEAALCEVAGITAEEVDSFDMNYSNVVDAPPEPGDCPAAPYYRQHQIASGIERLLAAEMEVDWLTYERHVSEVGQPSRVDPLSEPLIDDDIPF